MENTSTNVEKVEIHQPWITGSELLGIASIFALAWWASEYYRSRTWIDALREWIDDAM